jgi:hypothetical protein
MIPVMGSGELELVFALALFPTSNKDSVDTTAVILRLYDKNISKLNWYGDRITFEQSFIKHAARLAAHI